MSTVPTIGGRGLSQGKELLLIVRQPSIRGRSSTDIASGGMSCSIALCSVRTSCSISGCLSPTNAELAHAERHCIIAFLMPDRIGISGEECCMNVALILESTPN